MSRDELRTAFGDGWDVARITAETFALNPMAHGAVSAQAWLAVIRRH